MFLKNPHPFSKQPRSKDKSAVNSILRFTTCTGVNLTHPALPLAHFPLPFSLRSCSSTVKNSWNQEDNRHFLLYFFEELQHTTKQPGTHLEPLLRGLLPLPTGPECIICKLTICITIFYYVQIALNNHILSSLSKRCSPKAKWKLHYHSAVV